MGPAGPVGSAQVERVFLDYFGTLRTDPWPFDSGADYQPFIDRGAPAGGLFAGADAPKTLDQAAAYGGTAGAPYDPCFTLACDTINNLSNTAFDQLSDAAATALVLFGWTRDPVTTTTLHRLVAGEPRGSRAAR